jgi:tRNA/tmRNA/rRNA uracil-C5-methylase (TrmA/RlmC/RlmD family)
VSPASSGGNPPADQSVSVVAEKLVGGGRAIAHHDGATWMVGGALPGERIRAEVTKRRAGIVEARTLEVLSESHPARSKDPCPHSGVCGGCDWPHVDPGAGADLKAAAAAEAARAFPELAARIASAPIHRSDGGYRLRARLHWDAGQNRLGFYEHRSRQVASIDSCRILSPRLMGALPQLTKALSVRCAECVDVEWLEGTEAESTVAALRPAKGGPKKIDPEWVPGRDEMGPVVSGFHYLSKQGNLNSVWGATEVRIELPIPLDVPIGCFFQGNRHLILPLFRRVVEIVGRDAAPVYDLHAGVGYLAAAARFAGERDLTLVEPHREAALAAGRNLPGARVIVGATAEAFIAGAGGLPPEALVITDPPRTGLSRNLRRHLARWQPDRILMLGCDPATWARDAGFLGDHGFEPRVVEIFDLFPSTHHVEILALLER